MFEVPPKPAFPLGNVTVSYQVNWLLASEDVSRALARHAECDWGDICEEDRMENEHSLKEGRRLLSVYHDRNGVKLWIITEADRSATTVLMPDDY